MILSKRDVIAIMPTGSGKSICYQLPAVALDGITLVVSPLISLMRDLKQVGISAAYLNSTLTSNQLAKAIENAKQSLYKIIYVAPERLLTDDFMELALSVKISFIAVDEAHCISKWGHDFRPSYRSICTFINKLVNRPVIAAFTATATSEVKEDIIDLLELNDPYCISTGFDRENLYFDVVKTKDKLDYVINYLKTHDDKSGIIYCSTRKAVEDVYEEIIGQGFTAAKYHAGLMNDQRRINQDSFLFDKCRIMVSTNAFGMGIDKSNVSFVIHYNMPMNLEAYYQEAGRAGRDGEPVECILLYTGADVRLCKYLIDQTVDKYCDYDHEHTEAVRKNEYEKLKLMTYYATSNYCLRKNILEYFGEKAPGFCGKCVNCNKNSEVIDITREARLIITTINKTGGRFGREFIVDILIGSQNKKVVSRKFDNLDEYGVLSSYDRNHVRDIIDWLIYNDYIIKEDTKYPSLKVADRSDSFSDEDRLFMKCFNVKKKTVSNSDTNKSQQPDNILMNELKKLRLSIAQKEGVPAFVVFTDATLREMCMKKPGTLIELKKISGVGEVKLNKYGNIFIELIRS